MVEDRKKVEQNDLFKIEGSKRQRLEETIINKKTYLIENGRRIAQIGEEGDVNHHLVLISAGTQENYLSDLEFQARDYVKKTIVPSSMEMNEAWGDETLWFDMVYNAVKDQPLRFVGAVFSELKNSFLPVDKERHDKLLDHLSKKLETVIVERYNKETEEEKKIFKGIAEETLTTKALFWKIK